MNKTDIYDGCIKMTHAQFDSIEDNMQKMEYRADKLVPDFDKAIDVSENPEEFLKYLIWYEATVSECTETADAVDEAWDYINQMVILE